MKTHKNNIEAIVRKLPEGEDRTVTFVASTNAKDRHGTILNQENWDIKNFNNNPIIGYQHNVYGGDMCNAPDPDDQLGFAKAYIDTNKKGQTELLVDVTFEPEDINPKAEKIFRKVKHGSLNAVSVGFVPLKNTDGEIGQYGFENARGKVEDKETFYYFGQELLELSVVNIPSNPEALKKSVRNDTANALTFLSKRLDKRFSEIEDMKVRDILDILDGKKDDVILPPKKEEKNIEDNKVCNIREKILTLHKMRKH